MAKNGASAAVWTGNPHPANEYVVVENKARVPDAHRALRPAFATQGHARLLDILGWQIEPSPRREEERHAPAQCCFVLQDGRREEAAFGYTGLTLPQDTGDAALREAQRRVERFLALLGEDRGVLFQNVPLLAFAGHRRERVAIFGGWRFTRGDWKPFFLGPDGLGGVAAQETFFSSGTAPGHVAGICGHPADRVMPRIADLVAAIAAIDGQAVVRKPVQLHLVPHAGGWSIPQVSQPAVTAVRPLPPQRLASGAAVNTAWDPGTDEFRFHQYGTDRG